MAEEVSKYLSFRCGTNYYGVDITRVVEILEYKNPKLMNTEFPYILGFIGHRDGVVPIVDTSLKFGGEPINRDTCCIIVLCVESSMGEEFNIGLIVSQVSDIIEVYPGDKRKIENSYKPGYVDFVVSHNDNLVLVLNSDKVFTDTDIINMKNLASK